MNVWNRCAIRGYKFQPHFTPGLSCVSHLLSAFDAPLFAQAPISAALVPPGADATASPVNKKAYLWLKQFFPVLNDKFLGGGGSKTNLEY